MRVAGHEVDFLWREHKLVVEVDGFAYHATRNAFERDRRRDADLQAAGHRVIRLTWRQIAREPHAVVARLAEPHATMTAVSGTREFYETGYSLTGDEGARMGRWRALGARSKGAHAIALCARAGLRPAALAEIGCGDGALLAELAAQGLSPVLDGFELSPKAAAIAASRQVARRVEAFDGVHVPAQDGAYDLAILSHVLEHVPDPLPLLKEAARIAPYVLVEVPLEDNRSARRPTKRKLAENAGHLHSYTRASLHAQLKTAGLTAHQQLADPLSYEHHAFFDTRAKAAAKHTVRATIHRLAPHTAERLFTVHYAVLASVEQPLGPRQ